MRVAVRVLHSCAFIITISNSLLLLILLRVWCVIIMMHIIIKFVGSYVPSLYHQSIIIMRKQIHNVMSCTHCWQGCYIHVYCRIPRLRPPFLHARIGQKWGGGLYAGSLHFRVTTITDRRMPCGRMISVLSPYFSDCLMGKTQKRQSKAYYDTNS